MNHINGIKTDNRPENLEYLTTEQHVAHSVANGLVIQRTGEQHYNARLSNDDARKIKTELEQPEKRTQKEIGRQYGVSTSAIGAIAQGRNWKQA